MAWLVRAFASTLQKRFTRFILNKTVGPFLSEKLSMDQIELRALDGEFVLTDLVLGPEAIGKLIPDLPFRVVEGSVDEISGMLPYKNIMQKGCELRIRGLRVVVSPNPQANAPSASTKESSTSPAPEPDDNEEEFWRASEEGARAEGVQSLDYMLETIKQRISVIVEDVSITILDAEPTQQPHPSEGLERSGSSGKESGGAATDAVESTASAAASAPVSRSTSNSATTLTPSSSSSSPSSSVPLLDFPVGGLLVRLQRARYSDETHKSAPDGKAFDPVTSPVAIKQVLIDGLTVFALSNDGSVAPFPILSTGLESHLLSLTLRKLLGAGQFKVDANLLLQQLHLVLEPRLLGSILHIVERYTPSASPAASASASAPPMAMAETNSTPILPTLTTILGTSPTSPPPLPIASAAAPDYKNDSFRVHVAVKSGRAIAYLDALTLPALAQAAHSVLSPILDGASTSTATTFPTASLYDHIDLDFAGANVDVQQPNGSLHPSVAFSLGNLSVHEVVSDAAGATTTLSSTLPSSQSAPIDIPVALGRYPVLRFASLQPVTPVGATPALTGHLEISDHSTQLRINAAPCELFFDVSLLDRLSLLLAVSAECAGTNAKPTPASSIPLPAQQPSQCSPRSLEAQGFSLSISAQDCRVVLLTPLPVFASPSPSSRPRHLPTFDVGLSLRLHGLGVLVLPTGDSNSPDMGESPPPHPHDGLRLRLSFIDGELGLRSMSDPHRTSVLGTMSAGLGGGSGGGADPRHGIQTPCSVVVAMRDEPTTGSARPAKYPATSSSNNTISLPFLQEGPSISCRKHSDIHGSVFGAMHSSAMVVLLSLGKANLQMTKQQYADLMTFVSHITLYEPFTFGGRMFAEFRGLAQILLQGAGAAPLVDVEDEGEDDGEDGEPHDGSDSGRSEEDEKENSGSSEESSEEDAEDSEAQGKDEKQQTSATSLPPAVSGAVVEPTASIESPLATIHAPAAPRAPLPQPGSSASVFYHFMSFSATVHSVELVMDAGIKLQGEASSQPPEGAASADSESGTTPPSPSHKMYRIKAEGVDVGVLHSVNGQDRMDMGLAASHLELYEAGEGDADTTSDSVDPPSQQVEANVLVLSTTGMRNFSTSSDGYGAVQLGLCIQKDARSELKTMTIVADVRSGCLHHVMKTDGENWLLQLIDFTDVPSPEYPIASPAQMMRLHIHFRDLGITYNPTHLPVCSLITSQHAYVSSHIVPLAALSTLTFQFSETRLYLADEERSIALFEHGITPPHEAGYALTMYDPSLKVVLQLCSDAARPPAVDVSIVNESLEVDVCSDSMSSLMAIFQHYFTSGDLPAPVVSAEAEAAAITTATGLAAVRDDDDDDGGAVAEGAASGVRTVRLLHGDGSMMLREDEDNEDAMFYSAIGDVGALSPSEEATAISATSSSGNAHLASVSSSDTVFSSSAVATSGSETTARRNVVAAPNRRMLAADLSDALSEDRARGRAQASAAPATFVQPTGSLAAGGEDDIFLDAEDDYFSAEQTCSQCHRAVFLNGLCKYHNEIAKVQQTKPNNSLLLDALAGESSSEVSSLHSSLSDSRGLSASGGEGRDRGSLPGSPLRVFPRSYAEVLSSAESASGRSSSSAASSTVANMYGAIGGVEMEDEGSPTRESRDTVFAATSTAVGRGDEDDDVAVPVMEHEDDDSHSDDMSDMDDESLPDPTTPRAQLARSPPSAIFTPSSPAYGMPKRLIAEPTPIVHDHFKTPILRVTTELQSDIFPPPKVRVAVHDATVHVRLHSGADWKHAEVVDLVERQAECIELSVSKLGVCFEVYAEDMIHSARLSMVARDITILDKVEKSLMNFILTCLNTEASPRETDESMARFDMVFVRTPGTTDEELMLRLAILPLRLNLDQDTLDFLVTFFAFMQAYEQRLALERPADAPVAPAAPPPYIKLCLISPIVAMIDYDPKHVAFSSLLRGNMGEMAGLVSLRQSTLVLPSVFVKGIQGFDILAKDVVNAWLSSYSDKLPGLLSGVPVVRPVHNVVAAGAHAMYQPFVSYPRVLQGFRQGVVSGLTTTTVEFCNVSSALLFGMQRALEAAQTLVSSPIGGLGPRVRVAQPANTQIGLAAAAGVLREGFTRFWRRWNPSGEGNEGSRRSMLGTVAGAVADLPAASLQPLIAVCESVSLALQGFRNSLHPDTHRDLQAKYRQ